MTFGMIGSSAAHGLALTGFMLVMQASLSALRLGDYYPEAGLATAIGMAARAAVKNSRCASTLFQREPIVAWIPSGR